MQEVVQELGSHESLTCSIPKTAVSSRFPGAVLQSPSTIVRWVRHPQRGRFPPGSNKEEELAIEPSAAMSQPLSQGLKPPKVFLSSYLTRQMSLAHLMPL